MNKYSAVATATTATMVEIVAPTSLREGYTVDAVYNGIPFKATVPPGGVEKGQTFVVPFSPDMMTETPVPNEFTGLSSGDDAPLYQWKDGICDCCRLGVVHPSFLNACCCPQILMAQVLTRMRMNWLGTPSVEGEWKKTFQRVLTIVVVYFTLSTIFAPPAPDFTVDGKIIQNSPPAPVWLVIVSNLINGAFGLYTVIVLMKLRKAVRTRYHIPEQNCPGMEDFCCSFWCTCCTVAQLARHTANYEDRRAIYCSKTGLPERAPVMIV